MAIISAVKKFRGNLLDRPGIPITTIGTGLTVLNSDALTATDGTAADILKIMGDSGALESDVHTNGSNVIRQTVPPGSRFLDIFTIVIDNNAVPGDLTTAPAIRVYGMIGGPQDGTINSSQPHLVSEYDGDFVEPSNWWIPLVDENGANEITLNTEAAITGEDSGGVGYALTAPKYVRVAGVNQVAVVITTAGALAAADQAMILGRYTT